MECNPKWKFIFIGALSILICLFTLHSPEMRLLSIPNPELVHQKAISLHGGKQNAAGNEHNTICSDKSKPSFVSDSIVRYKPRDSTMKSSDVRIIQKNRIKNIRRVCSNSTMYELSLYKDGISQHALFKARQSQRFYFSPKYKFIYCKVPKVGSTFWSQVFEILHNFGSASKLLTKGRNVIHGGMIKYYSQLSYQYKTRYPAVIPARNPFTRLFSAFVDKSYLNLMPRLNQGIRLIFPREAVPERNATDCPLDVTFQEFLDYIIIQTQSGHKLDRHWTPIYSLCVPCTLNVEVVVEHETNKQDMMYAMDELGITDGAADEIISIMNENRTKSTIPGVIKTAYSRVKTDCMSRVVLVRRLWNAFQYQGFIRYCQRFPEHLLNETTSDDLEYVTGLIQDTIQQNPMSSAEIYSQRRRALVKGYTGIKKKTIAQIRKIYEIDFKLFGYSPESPG